MSTERKYVDYPESHGRVPLIALDYSQRHLRRLKEIMIDYTNGNLYIVDAYDRDKIYNLADKIMQDYDITGDNVLVNIEGVGEINLTKFLEYLRNNTLQVEVTESGNNIPIVSVDTNSIEILDDKVQVVSFKEASNGTIPQKVNGRIQWVNAGAGIGASEVKDVILQDNIAYLAVGNTYRSSNLPTEVNVTLGQEFASDYGKIVWNVSVTDVIPIINLEPNVKMAFNTHKDLFQNCIATFEFETFTRGNIWLCKVTKWLNVPEKEITESYIIDKLSWKYIGE